MEKKLRDRYWMSLALKLAKQGKGKTLPNPLVGAVIVKDNELIGKGYHESYGARHAEDMAIQEAYTDVTGATMYVTLEPCSHYGKRPPCVYKIMDHGISRVVVAMSDPNPLVAGKGIKLLREEGIEVEVGVLEEEARDLNAHFLHYITKKKPYVLYKGAMTLDGKVATKTGDAKNISCEKSRELVHHWRDEYQGIMVGVGTVLADDPQLTARIPHGRSPVRIVIDSTLKTPEDAKMLSLKEGETWIYTTAKSDRSKRKVLEENPGVKVFLVDEDDRGQVNLDCVLEHIAEQGLASVLLEGGPRLASSMFACHAVNQLALFVSPRIIGGGAKNILEGVGVEYLKDAYDIKELTVKRVGEDILIQGRVQ